MASSSGMVAGRRPAPSSTSAPTVVNRTSRSWSQAVGHTGGPLTERGVGDVTAHLGFTLHRGVRWHDGRPTTARDVAWTLTAARDPETGGSFGDAQLADQIATMILAGHETTATALFWSLYLLSLDTDAQGAASGMPLDDDSEEEDTLPLEGY